MNEQQAMTAVAKMYAAHGSLKPAEVVAELASEALDSSCGSCAKAVLETARGGKYPLTVQTYREAFKRTLASGEHSFHIGVDDAQVDVGKAEADWRRRGVNYLVDAGMELNRAKVAAAMQWANAITICTDNDTRAWDSHVPAHVTDETIEAAWTYARACVLFDPTEMDDGTWRGVVGRWEQAFRQGASA